MEHALRAVAMDAHVRANLWVRNGLSIHDMVWVSQTGLWIVLLLASEKRSDPIVIEMRIKPPVCRESCHLNSGVPHNLVGLYATLLKMMS
jgi:hypothetical protein